MVIAIIAILAALLLPVLSTAKAKAHRIACLNNIRQLQLSWHLYADDYNGNLPLNTGLPVRGSWVDGNAKTDSTKPDGAPQKLLDVSKLNSLGWKAKTSLEAGAAVAYADFLAKQK